MKEATTAGPTAPPSLHTPRGAPAQAPALTRQARSQKYLLCKMQKATVPTAAGSMRSSGESPSTEHLAQRTRH